MPEPLRVVRSSSPNPKGSDQQLLVCEEEVQRAEPRVLGAWSDHQTARETEGVSGQTNNNPPTFSVDGTVHFQTGAGVLFVFTPSSLGRAVVPRADRTTLRIKDPYKIQVYVLSEETNTEHILS